MIIIITGTTHTGKTLLSQRLLEKYNYPYLSIDHLKMGLIRSGHTMLTPYSSQEELTDYLWPIIVEIIKTNIENKQNLIIEGCYIPFNYQEYFDDKYLDNIKYCCLIMGEDYIRSHYVDIVRYSNIVENRINDDLDINGLIEENKYNLKQVLNYNLNYYLIKDKYIINLEDLI